jgi:hypothetical protein
MRQTISGLVAAIAVFTAAPAFACGGLFGGGCAPCAYVSPCGAAYERLPDPEVQYHAAPVALPQYYYVDQGPTFTGPGNFAPYPAYREGGISYRYHGYGYGYEGRYRVHPHYHRAWHAGYRYAPHHMHYGYASRHDGYRAHVQRRYY